jgi:hypothetical protein
LFARCSILLMCVIAICGCRSGAGPNATGASNAGFELSMYVRDDTGSEALYKIDQAGMISFGGGLDARLDHPTWSGPLLEVEIARIRDLLEAREWFRVKPESTGQPPGQLYRISLRTDQRSGSFRVKGEHPEIKPLRELLETASLRRLEVDLRRFPEPSVRRQPPVPASEP